MSSLRDWVMSLEDRFQNDYVTFCDFDSNQCFHEPNCDYPYIYVESRIKSKPAPQILSHLKRNYPAQIFVGPSVERKIGFWRLQPFLSFSQGDDLFECGELNEIVFLLWQPNLRHVLSPRFFATAIVCESKPEDGAHHPLFIWQMAKLSPD